MADIVAGYGLGIVVGLATWLFGRSMLSADVFQRDNYRSHRLPTAGGLLLIVGFGLILGMSVLSRDLRQIVTGSLGPRWDSLMIFGPQTLFLMLGFGLLGFIDDIAGENQSGGFRGHITALVSGHLTTGAVKMLGGPAIALSVVASTGVSTGRAGVLRDTALISLAANLGNLFDRAPGRTNKVAQLALLLMVVLDQTRALVPAAVVGGVALGLLVPDLREQMMLGDAGSNVLGAVMGFAYVLIAHPNHRWVAVLILLVANVASEFVSFTRVIDSVAPLRFVDRLGSPFRS